MGTTTARECHLFASHPTQLRTVRLNFSDAARLRLPARVRPDALAAPVADLKLAEARKATEQTHMARDQAPAQVAANVAALMRNPQRSAARPVAAVPVPEPSNSTAHEAPQSSVDDHCAAIRELFDVPNPESSKAYDILRKADVTVLSDALKWKVDNILQGCKANAYGVVEYEHFEKLMLHRLTKNFSGDTVAFAAKMRSNAVAAKAKIHPNQVQEAVVEASCTKDTTNEGAAPEEMSAVDRALALAFATMETDDTAEASAAAEVVEVVAQPTKQPAVVHDSESEPMFGYRCQKCRIVLFKSTDVDETGRFGEASEMKHINNKCWNKGNKATMDDSVKLTSLFISEAVATKLGGDEMFAGPDSGKLYCPGCQAKLGSFKWSGEQDNRGHFHSPSFNIPKSKVDRMPWVAGPAALNALSVDDDADKVRLTELYSVHAPANVAKIDAILAKRPTRANRDKMWLDLEKKYPAFFLNSKSKDARLLLNYTL